MKTKAALLIVFSFLFLLPLAQADSWEVVPSAYTPYLKKIESAWPISGLSSLSDQSENFKIEGISTTGNEFFIGVAQMVSIKAPLSTVAQFLDHFTEYPKYFDGLNKAEVLESRVESGIQQHRIFFEQNVPIPLVPNDKSEMVYTIKSIGESRKIYHYQLHQGNNLISNDGMIILDAISSRLTRYFEIDFWDAHWGIAKTVGAKKIWSDSMKGLLQSDFAIKLKSENPGWTEKEVVKESKKLVDAYPVENRYQSRTNAKDWMKAHGIDLEK